MSTEEISEIPAAALDEAPVDEYHDDVLDAAEALAEYQSPARVISAVQGTYIERCIDADGMDTKDEAFALAHCLIKSADVIASNHDELSVPLVLADYAEYVDTYAGEIAQAASTKKEIVSAPLVAQLNAAVRNARDLADDEDLIDEEEVKNARDAIDDAVDGVGVGVDRYIEEHLEAVKVKQSTDHTNDETVVFEFDDGKTVDMNEAKYHSFGEYYRELGDGGEVTVRGLVESTEGAEYLDGDITDADEKKPEYRKASLGPEERPWHVDTELWDEAMSHLMSSESEYFVETPRIPGPRTDAIEDIMRTVASQNASRDRHNAADEGAVYVDEQNDDLWVPYTIVDSAVEDVAATREDVIYELSKRDMISSTLSGNKISKRVGDDRYWLFDLTHSRVREPAAVVDELRTGTDSMLDVSDDDGGVSAAADGGSTAFGRTPDDEDDGGDEEQDDGDTDDESGGDDE